MSKPPDENGEEPVEKPRNPFQPGPMIWTVVAQASVAIAVAASLITVWLAVGDSGEVALPPPGMTSLAAPATTLATNESVASTARMAPETTGTVPEPTVEMAETTATDDTVTDVPRSEPRAIPAARESLITALKSAGIATRDLAVSFTEEGAAVLTGFVESDDDREEAGRIAGSQGFVVENLLEVGIPETDVAEPAPDGDPAMLTG